MKRPTRKHPVLALVGALALVACGCQRAAVQSERTPTTEPRVAQAPPPAAPIPSPEPPPTVAERHDVEQPPRSVAPPIPPTPPPQPNPESPGARERRLDARERRLARRQAELRKREERLRQQESTAAPAPAPAPSEEPAPEPAPAPEPPAPEPPAPPVPSASPVTVPAGTQLGVKLGHGLSSATSKVGETFRTQVTEDVYAGDQLVIPAGSEIVGEVTQAQPLRKKIGGKAVLGLRFTDLILPTGETVPIHASLKQEGENKGKGDAATIGGATAGGAILGRILSGGGDKGTVIGALIGAVAGAAIAAHRPGQEVVIPEGTVLGVVFDQPVELHRQR
jgi:type IV secretory pathway VirB10-like protein